MSFSLTHSAGVTLGRGLWRRRWVGYMAASWDRMAWSMTSGWLVRVDLRYSIKLFKDKITKKRKNIDADMSGWRPVAGAQIAKGA
jgi:hypothetical protein